jgi:prepilin-type N-terminal cleavage/methylation domain-containing protein/prepilin-type processing-associated H-X9-DG protein
MHSTRKGFTLIELLVVIAIIAILAAILFPVFAQAKQSAKGAASLSNNKQIVLGAIMYSADYDDMAVLAQKWDLGGRWDLGASTYMSVWYDLVNPYMKSYALYEDPLVGRVYQTAGFTREDILSIFGQYGYNHVTLSPLRTPFSTPTWSPVSMTAAGSPADTVMMTAMMAFLVETEFYGWWGPSVPWTTAGLIDSPTCGFGYAYEPLCWDGWGNSYYWGPDFFGGSNGETAGRFTGGVALRATNQAIVGYVDGHVKKSSAAGLAKGTNWTKTIDPGAVVVTDINQYLWDLQ